MDGFVLYQCSRCGEATCCNVLGMDFMCRSCGREMEECGVYVHSDLNAELLEALEALVYNRFIYSTPDNQSVQHAALASLNAELLAALEECLIHCGDDGCPDTEFIIDDHSGHVLNVMKIRAAIAKARKE